MDAAGKSGLKREEILDFSSSVNPLGPSKKALEAAKKAFTEIPAYPDSNSNELRQAIAGHFSGLTKTTSSSATVLQNSCTCSLRLS